MVRVWTKLVLDAEGNWVADACQHEEHEGDIAECKGATGGTTTVQQADPWVGQQSYLKYGFQQAAQLYNNKNLWPQYYSGNTVASLSPDTQAAIYMTQQRAMNGSPLQSAAQNQMLQTISGQYLNQNPYLNKAIDSALSPVMRQYRDAVLPGVDAQFSRSGRYGSNAYDTSRARSESELATALGNIANDMAYQNYRDERNNQNAATLAAPAFAQADYNDSQRLAAAGAIQDNQAQAVLDSKMNQYNYNANLPKQMLADYMALIQGNYGSSSSSVTTPSKPNPLAQGINGALTGLSLGSMIPGIGSVLGAGLGGLFGLVM